MVFAFDAETGDHRGRRADDIDTPPGSGPRHIAIAPTGKFAYVCGELDSTVNVIEFGDEAARVRSCSRSRRSPSRQGELDRRVHPAPERQVRVRVQPRAQQHRGLQSDPNRKLTAAGHITGDIKIPRNFNIDPSGKWMLIASQDGGKVGVWGLDEKTGMGKETGNSVAVSRCVCVKFVPVAE